MAEITFTGNKTVKSLQADFKKAFNVTLRVYNGVSHASPTATLASLRKEGKKGGELKVAGNILVGNFEKKVDELYGIRVQVASADDSHLSKDSITLAAAGKE